MKHSKAKLSKTRYASRPNVMFDREENGLCCRCCKLLNIYFHFLPGFGGHQYAHLKSIDLDQKIQLQQSWSLLSQSPSSLPAAFCFCFPWKRRWCSCVSVLLGKTKWIAEILLVAFKLLNQYHSHLPWTCLWEKQSNIIRLLLIKDV